MEMKEGDSELLWTDNKNVAFAFEVVDLLQSCGFMPLYSGNAYDAFLKMLLSSDDPLGLFQYIWSMKTNSRGKKTGNI
jgi:hypothetical protein